MTFNIGQYRIETTLHSCHGWTHIRLHKSAWRTDSWKRHFIWGKLSIYIDTPDIDTVSCCPYCNALTEERGFGDEGWTFCSEDCGCLEGANTVEMSVRDFEKQA